MLEPIRKFNGAHPVKWRHLPNGGRETDSRGVRCWTKRGKDGRWETVTSESSSGDLCKPVTQAAQSAIRAAGKMAEFMRGWANEFAPQQGSDNTFELAPSNIIGLPRQQDDLIELLADANLCLMVLGDLRRDNETIETVSSHMEGGGEDWNFFDRRDEADYREAQRRIESNMQVLTERLTGVLNWGLHRGMDTAGDGGSCSRSAGPSTGRRHLRVHRGSADGREG